MKTSAQDSVVSARTYSAMASVINDGKFLMNFRAQPLCKSMVRSVVGVVYIGVVSGGCPLHRIKSAWLCQISVRCSEHGGCPLLGGCFYTKPM